MNSRCVLFLLFFFKQNPSLPLSVTKPVGEEKEGARKSPSPSVPSAYSISKDCRLSTNS